MGLVLPAENHCLVHGQSFDDPQQHLQSTKKIAGVRVKVIEDIYLLVSPVGAHRECVIPLYAASDHA